MELAAEDKGLVGEVLKCLESVEDSLHAKHCERWLHFDALYHNYQGLKDAHASAAPKDRWPILKDARGEFGHELFIPYSFSVVEVVMARLVAHRPRMLVLPRNSRSEKNVENMRALIDAQQDQIDYELVLHDVGKSGLQRGLGVQKTSWRRREQQSQKVVPSSWVLRALGKPWQLQTYTEKLFDDPVAEHVDIYDWFWDGYASEIDGCGWAIHRAWRNTGYVREKFESGEWALDGLTPEVLETEGGAASLYAKAWGPRLEVRGLPKPSDRDPDIHEVLEYHNRGNVVTVLDRKWPVRAVASDCPGHLGFQVSRPTKVLNSMVGKGEVEPIEDLQLEMNMMRTDRRWNSLLKLHTPIFYNDGVLEDPHSIKYGPGELNAVNGDPREIIFMPNVGDIPYSSFREAQEMQADIERTSGISDSSSGVDGGGAQTATGIQLVHAAANARINLKARRLEVEIIKAGARHWGKLNQRHILEEREQRIASPPQPGQPERRWSWLKLGPGELMGEFEFTPDGGSTTPENIPQQRQDAQLKAQLLGQSQLVDQGKLMLEIAEGLGVKNPESLILAQPRVPPQTLEYIAGALGQAGMDQAQARELVGAALHQAMDDEQAAQAGNGQNGQGVG